MSREKFREVYGKDIEEKIGKTAITANQQEIALAVEPHEGDDPFSWSDNEGITILHHFEVKYEKDTLYKMSNGEVFNQEEMDELIEKSREMNRRNQMMDLEQQLMGSHPMPQEMPATIGMEQEASPMMPPSGSNGFGMSGNADIIPQENGLDVTQAPVESDMDFEENEPERMTLWHAGEMVRIEDKRPAKKHKIFHYLFAGDYELDKTEFPSEQLPMPFVANKSWYDKTGKQICCSFFQDAKESTALP